VNIAVGEHIDCTEIWAGHLAQVARHHISGSSLSRWCPTPTADDPDQSRCGADGGGIVRIDEAGILTLGVGFLHIDRRVSRSERISGHTPWSTGCGHARGLAAVVATAGALTLTSAPVGRCCCRARRQSVRLQRGRRLLTPATKTQSTRTTTLGKHVTPHPPTRLGQDSGTQRVVSVPIPSSTNGADQIDVRHDDHCITGSVARVGNFCDNQQPSWGGGGNGCCDQESGAWSGGGRCGCDTHGGGNQGGGSRVVTHKAASGTPGTTRPPIGPTCIMVATAGAAGRAARANRWGDRAARAAGVRVAAELTPTGTLGPLPSSWAW
jgi:hypothetical protein